MSLPSDSDAALDAHARRTWHAVMPEGLIAWVQMPAQALTELWLSNGDIQGAPPTSAVSGTDAALRKVSHLRKTSF